MVSKIVLIGYMGVGKSTIGKELAKKTNLIFHDLDEIIKKKENKSIEELFRLKGELYFRKIEHQLFKSLLENDDSFILSTGGGTPCYYNNHLLLESERVATVYLEASIGTIYNRLISEKQQRPLLKNLNALELNEFIGKHLFERSFYYQKANYKIKVDSKSVLEICDEIRKVLL